MITNIQELKRYIQADAASRGVHSLARAFVFDPIFRFTIYLRLNEYLVNAKFGLISRILPWWLFRRLSVRLGFSVPVNVFGPGLAIVHYGLLVVNPTARVGANCRIHAGVNIGAAAGFYDLSLGEWRTPIIGDNVYIGPGVKIFGPVEIGNGCVIGANAVVNKSFPDCELTIAGVPAKVIAKRGSAGLVHPNPYI